MDKTVGEELKQVAESSEEKTDVSDESTILFEAPARAETENDERYERLKQERTVSGYYKGQMIRKGIWLSVWFTFLLGTLQPGMRPITEMDWLSQLAFGLVIVEMVLLYCQELHVTGAIVCLAVGLTAMLQCRQYMLYAVWLLGVVIGKPVIVLAGVGATFFWSLLEHYGLEGWLPKLMVGPLEYIVLILALWNCMKIIALKYSRDEGLLEEDGAEG